MNIHRRNKVSAEGNVSSVQDLVFLLLIFFIILSTLATEGLPFNPPTASNTVNSTEPDIVVTITADTVFQVNEVVVEKDDVKAQVEALIAEIPEGTAPSLLLRVDKSVPTGETVFVMDVAKEYECKFVMATKKSGEE